LKSTVTRRQAEPVPSGIKERLAQLQHHQAAESARQTAVEAPTAAETEKPGEQVKREQNALQAAFLATNLGQPVVLYLINGVKLTGKLRQFDQFCILLEDPDGLASLVYKHAVCSIQPAGYSRQERPLSANYK
jgi:RNA chaperone Hfq